MVEHTRGRAMAGDIAKARRSIVTKPVVRSVSATRALASSLRRLGADEETVTKVTGLPPVRPAR